MFFFLIWFGDSRCTGGRKGVGLGRSGRESFVKVYMYKNKFWGKFSKKPNNKFIHADLHVVAQANFRLPPVRLESDHWYFCFTCNFRISITFKQIHNSILQFNFPYFWHYFEQCVPYGKITKPAYSAISELMTSQGRKVSHYRAQQVFWNPFWNSVTCSYMAMSFKISSRFWNLIIIGGKLCKGLLMWCKQIERMI